MHAAVPCSALPLTDVLYLSLDSFIGVFHVQNLRSCIVIYVHDIITRAVFVSCLYQNDFVFAVDSAFTITELQLLKTDDLTFVCAVIPA
jgi:hypothetical protein